jgi:quercetin dioxygenase-like cupin family protein
MKYPFKQEIISNKIIRTFSSEVQDEELRWHYDLKDRVVKVLEGENWKLQMDDELPEKLTPLKEYFIPKGVYHRVIKGENNLVIEITEFD